MGHKSQQSSTKGVPTSAGSRKHKFAAFFARTAERKLRHILRDHGRDAARKWAEDHNSLMVFLKMTQN